jgi:hypothetical protein
MNRPDRPERNRIAGQGMSKMKGTSGFAAVLMAAAGLAACSNSSSSGVLDPDPGSANVVAAMGESFQLRPGQTARIGDGLVVGFRGVTNDSRCATDVVCVWAGDATLRIPVSLDRATWQPLDLHTTIDPRSANVGSYTVTVVELTPAPKSDSRIPSDRYTVTLRVE